MGSACVFATNDSSAKHHQFDLCEGMYRQGQQTHKSMQKKIRLKGMCAHTYSRGVSFASINDSCALFQTLFTPWSLLEDVIPSHEDFETLFIEIQLSNACNLIVGSGYRTHGTPTDIFCRSSDSCLEKVRNEGNHYKIDDFIINLLISP